MDIAEKVKNRPESFVVDETGKPTAFLFLRCKYMILIKWLMKKSSL